LLQFIESLNRGAVQTRAGPHFVYDDDSALIHPLIHPLIQSLIHQLIHPLIQSLIHQLIQP